jgi:hypothetical protein
MTGLHKIWVYDVEFDGFEFIELNSVIRGKHKMIKNKIANITEIKTILDSEVLIDEEYDLILKTDTDSIKSTIDHKFGVFNIESETFEMKRAEDIRPEMDCLIVF